MGVNMKYELILFDADETLFDFRKSEKYAFENSMREFNLSYNEDYHLKIYSDINAKVWKEFEEGSISQEMLKIERFKRLSNKLGIYFNEVDFARAYMNHLSDASFLYNESVQLIEDISKNHRLAIITNGLKEVQNKRVGKSIISNYFETIAISEELQVAKPDPKIFEITLSSINYTDKSKVLMVGDSLTSDIQGGINFGIDTCWYNPNKSTNKSKITPTYEINCLMDLKSILD